MADDPVLLITGASSGIGAATARAAAPKYRLVLAARREEELEALADGARRRGAGARRALRRHRVGPGARRWPRPRWSASAASTPSSPTPASAPRRGFLEESPEHWRSMVLTNVYGVALTIRATLPHLLERGDGHFLITSSIAGRRVLPGSLYSATKWAATAIGEALRAELRQMHENHGIKVTLIEPGMVDTALLRQPPRRLRRCRTTTSPAR